MLRSSLFVTLLSLIGLLLGFARELLLIRHWGTGVATDSFLVGMFLPDALRTVLASGLLVAVGLPLWQSKRNQTDWKNWSGTQSLQLLSLSLLVALAITQCSPWLVHAIGPGLDQNASQNAANVLQLLAWSIPGVMLHSWLSTYWQAAEKFTWPAACLSLFNIPMVAMLLLQPQADAASLAKAVIGGSILSVLPMLPGAWQLGWRPLPRNLQLHAIWQFYLQLGPLLASSGMSQLAPWLERVLASLLPEGAVTMVNLARKLLALPMVALASLAQIVLGRLAQPDQDSNLTLRQALAWTAQLCVPAAALLAAISPIVAHVVLAKASDKQLLEFSLLLAGFAACLLFAGWNGMLVRFFYAHGDTRFPARIEIGGMLLHMLLLAGSFYWLGLASMVLGGIAGVACGWSLLLRATTAKVFMKPMLINVGGMSLLCAISVQPQAGLMVQLLLALLALLIGGLLGAHLRKTMLSATTTSGTPS